MTWDTIWQATFFIGVTAFILLRIRLKATKRVFITDYQRGVKFVRGSFAGLVEPGSYLSYSPKEQITVVDMRTQPIVIERYFYQDALRAHSVISIGGELKVADPYRAVTTLKDHVNDSVGIVREALRTTVSKEITDGARDARVEAAERIKAVANLELTKFGMEVSNLEITELWSHLAKPTITAGAN